MLTLKFFSVIFRLLAQLLQIALLKIVTTKHRLFVGRKSRSSNHRVGHRSRGSGLPIKRGSRLRAMNMRTRRCGNFSRVVLDQLIKHLIED